MKEAQLRSRAGRLVEEDIATRRARLRMNQPWARREMNRRVRKDRSYRGPVLPDCDSDTVDRVIEEKGRYQELVE